MATTFLTHKTQIQRLIKDASTGDTESLIEDAINWAYHQLASLPNNPYLETSSTIELGIGAHQKVLPSDFVELIDIRVNGDASAGLTVFRSASSFFNCFTSLTTTANPACCTICENTFAATGSATREMIFDSQPASAITYIIRYRKSVPVLSADTDEVVFPEHLRQYVTMGAISFLEGLEWRNPEVAAMAKEKFELGMKIMQQAQHTEEVSQE